MTVPRLGPAGLHVLQMRRAPQRWSQLQAPPGSAALQWIDISRSASSGPLYHSEANLLGGLTTSKDFAAAMEAKMHAGMVMVMTDAQMHPDSSVSLPISFTVMSSRFQLLISMLFCVSICLNICCRPRL